MEEFRRKLREHGEAFKRAAAASLYEEGLSLMATSLREVPVDTGRLRATGYCAPPVDEGDRISVTVGYGTDYAVYVHERTELHHPVGKAKYLQDPLDAASGGFRERISERTAAHLEAGDGVEAVTAELPTSPEE